MKYLFLLFFLFSNFAFGSGVTDNNFRIGDGQNSNKTIQFSRSGTTKPSIRWNESNAVVELSNDGTSFSAIPIGTASATEISNLALSTSVGSNALTISLKNKAGNTPTTGDAVNLGFRKATASDGTFDRVSATSATTLTISNGSTLGHASGVQNFIYVYAINNSGTIELAVSNRVFDEGSIITTVAEGGVGAADSATTIYSNSARTGVPLRLVGRLTSTQATAGAWASAMTEIALAPFRQVRDGIPSGAVMAFARTACPPEWYLANGTSLVRTDEPELFAAIGTSHGAADGSHFNLPDYRGRFLRGVDGGVARDPDRASRTAMNTGGLTGDNVGTVQGWATRAPNAAFTVSNPGDHQHYLSSGNGPASYSSAGGANNNTYLPTLGAGNHVHTVTGGDNESRPVNANVIYCVHR